MEKKYNLPEVSSDQTGKVNEPAISYNNALHDTLHEKFILQNPNRPDVFTDEEKLKPISGIVDGIQKF